MNETEETEKMNIEQTYRDMRGQELAEMPDMWNRIEAGFEEEKRQSDARKKIYRRRYLTLAAAALLIVVIAVPVITLTTRTGRNKSEPDNAAADNAVMESAEELSGDSVQSDDAQSDMAEETEGTSVAWEDSADADMQMAESAESADTAETAEDEETVENSVMDMVSDGYDWDNMPFTIYGTSYRLSTMTYADIQALGFEISEEYEDMELEEGRYTGVRTLAEAADHSYMYIRFKNFAGEGTKNVKECEILGVTFYDDDFVNSYDVALGNGVAFGMTADEVKAIMGEPADEYEADEDGAYSLIYKESSGEFANSVELTFKDGGLHEITMENYD